MNVKTCHICGRTLYKRKGWSPRSGIFFLRCYNTKHKFLICLDFNQKLKNNILYIQHSFVVNKQRYYLKFEFKVKPNKYCNLTIFYNKNSFPKTIIQDLEYSENLNFFKEKIKKLCLML